MRNDRRCGSWTAGHGSRRSDRPSHSRSHLRLNLSQQPLQPYPAFVDVSVSQLDRLLATTLRRSLFGCEDDSARTLALADFLLNRHKGLQGLGFNYWNFDEHAPQCFDEYTNPLLHTHRTRRDHQRSLAFSALVRGSMS